MLLVQRLWNRQQIADESGVALVLVVFVMLVGFIVTAIIATAIFFVINTNSGNKDKTQSFIAAESGRDQQRAQIVAANAASNCSGTTLSVSSAAGSQPQYTTVAKTSSSTTAPTSFSDGSLSSACPSPTTHFVAIQSTGTGPNGATSTIFSIYNWQVVSHSSSSGFMAGTNGSFHGVGGGSSSSTIVGDLVVRTNDYTCSGAEVVEGDLWVLGGADGSTGGNVILTGGCDITGSVYANGTVSTNGGNPSQAIVVGKSILAGGGVSMSSNGVTVGGGCTAADGATCGRLASGGAVSLTNTGSSSGVIKGTVTGTTTPTIQSNWKHPDGTAIVGTAAPAPTFPVPLNSSQNGGSTAGTVWAMTNWIELTASTSWGAGVTVLTCPNPNTALSSATGPVILDYSGTGCSATSGQTTTITLSGGNVPKDAVFLVAPGKTMKVQITGTLTGPSSPTTQLYFVHESLGTGNISSDCGRPTGDSFTVSGSSIAPRIMVYTACGLNGTWTGNLVGQLYVGGDVSYNGNFTCQPMQWTPTPSPMPDMACSILGSGGAAGGTTYDQSLGNLASQVEQ
jgi:hypothetical protein